VSVCEFCEFWQKNLKRSLARPRYRWEDNICVDLKKWSGGCGLDSFGSG
jgi:hypothetical protein